MKSLFKTIKLRKIESKRIKENYKGQYYVLFIDDTYKEVVFEEDLITLIENDNKKRIVCIFEAGDRIMLDRGIRLIGGEEENG